MDHRARSFGRGLVLLGLVALAGCSGRPTTVADYVKPTGPVEPWIVATPNPPRPYGRAAAKTLINWYTGDGMPGMVYVSVDGKPEKLFSTHEAHQEATIAGKSVYEFRLYAASNRSKPLATLKVSRVAR